MVCAQTILSIACNRPGVWLTSFLRTPSGFLIPFVDVEWSLMDSFSPWDMVRRLAPDNLAILEAV